MPPGMTICPVASIRCLADSADSAPGVAIAAIVSPATATSQRTTPSGVTTSPPRIMKSNTPPPGADKDIGMTPAGLIGPDKLLLASPGEYIERRVHGRRVLERVAHLPDDDFKGPERGDHVGLGDGPHRSPTPHLPGHLALSTGDHDAVLVEQ